MTGTTGGMRDRSLSTLRALIDRSLADVLMSAGMPVRRQHVPVAEFVADLRVSASLEAKVRQCEFCIEVEGEGLVLNAFKFTHVEG